jgi:hypothetical protein
LEVGRCIYEALAFLKEGKKVKLDAPEFELLPQLNTVAEQRSVLILIM